MRFVFGDAAYWVALVNRRDQWHSRVLEVTQALGPVNIVTTEKVLDEFLTHFSQHGPTLRSIAIRTVEDAFQRTSVKYRPQSHETFLAGLDLFKRRSDKEYSLTDCISMEAMREEGIRDVLTHDRHFVQEGFVTLF